MTIRVALADDHPIVLNGLEHLFAGEPDIEIVARCIDGIEAIKAIEQHDPDILVLDLQMRPKGGLDVLRETNARHIRTRVVLLTAAVADDEIVEAMRLGIRGLVLKEMAPRQLVDCVRRVHAGEQWIEPGALTRALEKMVRRDRTPRETTALTSRETEIVRMIAAGLRNKEIAERLSISEGTVKIHLHRIYEKVKVSGRLELAVYARDRGLV